MCMEAIITVCLSALVKVDFQNLISEEPEDEKNYLKKVLKFWQERTAE